MAGDWGTVRALLRALDMEYMLGPNLSEGRIELMHGPSEGAKCPAGFLVPRIEGTAYVLFI